jgi:hypothetical protein
MASNNLPNKNTALALDQKAVAGVDKYFATVGTLTIAGTSYTPAALKAVFQADIDATVATDTGKAQQKQQVAVQKAARAKAQAARKALKAHILGNFGPAAITMLEDFGIPVPKPAGKKTVASKAKGVANAKATRVARGTLGKVQKSKIKGTAATTTSDVTVARPPATSKTTPSTT